MGQPDRRRAGDSIVAQQSGGRRQAPEDAAPRAPKDLRDGGEGEEWRGPEEWAVSELVDILIESEDEVIKALSEMAKQDAAELNATCKAEDTLATLADDERAWRSLTGTGRIASWGNASRERVVKQAYHLYYRNPLARNIIRAYTFLTVGAGMKVKFPEGETKAEERWEDIARLNDWERLYRKIITTTYLCGEWFLVRFPLCKGKFLDKKTGRSKRDQLIEYLKNQKAEKISLRQLTPIEVAELLTHKSDREQVIGYALGSDMPKEWPEALYADDVTHFKIDDLDVCARGRSILEPILRYLTYHAMFLLDRVTLNAIRTRIPLVRKIKGGPKRKASVRAAMLTRKLPRPATVAIVSDTEEWVYPELHLDSANAVRDGRALLLMICAGVSMPEFLVTSDASNANLASIVASAHPIMALIADFRNRFGSLFEDQIEEVVGVRPTVEFPEISLEDVKNTVEALSIMFHDKIISKDTYAAKMGVNRGEEKEKLDDEADEDTLYDLTNPPPPPAGDQGDGGAPAGGGDGKDLPGKGGMGALPDKGKGQ